MVHKNEQYSFPTNPLMLYYIDCTVQNDELDWIEMHAIIHMSSNLNGKSQFTQRECTQSFDMAVFNSLMVKKQSGNVLVVKENQRPKFIKMLKNEFERAIKKED